jgi:hypothetical protein
MKTLRPVQLVHIEYDKADFREAKVYPSTAHLSDNVCSSKNANVPALAFKEHAVRRRADGSPRLR